jgi:hypothetical protein
VRPEGLGKLKKLIHLTGSGTRNLPACSIVPWNVCVVLQGYSKMALEARSLSVNDKRRMNLS